MTDKEKVLLVSHVVEEAMAFQTLYDTTDKSPAGNDLQHETRERLEGGRVGGPVTSPEHGRSEILGGVKSGNPMESEASSLRPGQPGSPTKPAEQAELLWWVVNTYFDGQFSNIVTEVLVARKIVAGKPELFAIPSSLRTIGVEGLRPL